MNSVSSLPPVDLSVVVQPQDNPKIVKEGTTMVMANNNQVPQDVRETAYAIADELNIPHERIRRLNKFQIMSFIEEKGECLK